MYETDLLLCIVFILLCAYLRTIARDFLRHRNQFWNIKGPKTVPITLIAYLFTARSDAGNLESSNQKLLSTSCHNLIFQIAFKCSKIYRRNIHASIPFGLAQNIFLSLMIQASHKGCLLIPNAWRRISLWNFLDFPTD